ncbi:hypothetical protein HPB52_000748 [Rhipicephalus sanguineus]|uniref:Endonuclease/exonuclease/phosphatase domain-containing protein n=1 Tax=Rhipicephalus sanguineus TaxID=34632 RepID=A0A9D4PIB1_RHISA|nr:hypothetical protein HPB52_000748 [Rhipicephalus sanguineus]
MSLFDPDHPLFVADSLSDIQVLNRGTTRTQLSSRPRGGAHNPMMDPTQHSTSTCTNHDMDSRPDDDQFNSPLPADPSDLDELTSVSDEDDRGTTQPPQESEGPADDQDPNWKLALSRRSRQKQNRRERERAATQQQAGQAAAPNATGNASTGHHSVNPSAAVAAASPTTTVSTASRQLRRKLPPLPRSDLKIVLRPKKGLAIKEYSTHQISRAIVAACTPHPQCTGNDFIVRIRPGSNIIIVSTPHEETARVLRRVNTLTLDGKNYEFNAYVAAPEGTLRGVIHGIDPGTPPEELLANLRVRTQGVKVHSARMLGDTNTAVVTFDGSMIPRYVLYYGGEVACHPYKATRQVCKVCLQQGHRSDVCPNPTAPVCRSCGLLNPPTDHPCAPQCQICGEGHLTGAKECRQRLKTIRQHPPPHQTKAYSERGRKPQRRPRWFSSERDAELAELRALITGLRTSHPAPTSTNSPAPVAPQSSNDSPVTLSTLQSMMRDLTQQITHQLTQQLNQTLLHQTTQLSARLDTIENRIDARISEQSSIARKKRATTGTTRAATQPLLDPEIWQWNCRGYRRKRGLLQQFIQKQLVPPDIIALQETGTHPALAGYEVFVGPEDGKVAILVKKAITVIGHDTIPDTNVDHVIIELILQVKKQMKKNSLIVLNVYSPPRQSDADLRKLIRGACRIAQGKEIIILGDFNAHHDRWGYRKRDAKGRQLDTAIDDFQLVLLNDPAAPTRLGNSVCQDTSPDLTLVRGNATYTWENMQETLGSDHCIVRIQLTECAKSHPIGQAKITDWDAFRKESTLALDHLSDLGDWTAQLRKLRDKCTKNIARTLKNPEVDGHLLHLWEARRSLIKRLLPAGTYCGALGIWASFEMSLNNSLFHQTSKQPTRLPPYPVIWILNYITAGGRPESRLYENNT